MLHALESRSQGKNLRTNRQAKRRTKTIKLDGLWNLSMQLLLISLFRQRSPISMAISLHVISQNLVVFWIPWSFLQTHLLTASSSHQNHLPPFLQSLGFTNLHGACQRDFTYIYYAIQWHLFLLLHSLFGFNVFFYSIVYLALMFEHRTIQYSIFNTHTHRKYNIYILCIFQLVPPILLFFLLNNTYN